MSGGPSIGEALRQATGDLYRHAWWFVPLNLLCGIVIAAGVLVWWALGLLPVLLVAPLLGPPLAALFRLGGLVVREAPIDRRAIWLGVRRNLGVSLGWAALGGVGVAALLANIAIGRADGGLLGWGLAILSAWGLVLGLPAWSVAWAVLLDPDRDGLPVRSRLWIAGLVVLARPVRVVLVSLVLAGVLALSAALFIGVATLGVAYVAIALTRFVLPAADRLGAG